MNLDGKLEIYMGSKNSYFIRRGAELVLIAEVHYGGEENFGFYEYKFSQSKKKRKLCTSKIPRESRKAGVQAAPWNPLERRP